MDHQKQTRDSLEKHNQLVRIYRFRFFQGPTQNIPCARSAKSIIKITIFISALKNIGKKLVLAPTTTTSRKFACFTTNFGTAVKKKQMRRQKEWQNKKRRGAKEWLRRAPKNNILNHLQIVREDQQSNDMIRMESSSWWQRLNLSKEQVPEMMICQWLAEKDPTQMEEVFMNLPWESIFIRVRPQSTLLVSERREIMKDKELN